MDNLNSLLQKSVPTDAFSLAWLKDAVNGWLIAGAVEGWSERTRSDRRMWMDRLTDFLDFHSFTLSTQSLRMFLLALQQGTERRCRGPLKPASMDHVHRLLRAFCSWTVKEELTDVDLMKKIPPPINRDDRVEPFTEAEVLRLLDAAKRTRNGKRDLAILLLLFDTGIRASELCSLRIRDLDLEAGKLLVACGKGGRSRVAPMGNRPRKALWDYLKTNPRSAAEYVFETSRGEPLSRNALRLLMDRLERMTGIRCYAHKFRHTCAVSKLRNGASAFEVQETLGHTTLRMTMRYVNLAGSDLIEAHRRSSRALLQRPARPGPDRLATPSRPGFQARRGSPRQGGAVSGRGACLPARAR